MYSHLYVLFRFGLDFLSCTFGHLTLPKLACNYGFLMYPNELIHIILWFEHDIPCIGVRTHSGATQISHCMMQRLVQWLVPVIPSILRSCNAEYICLNPWAHLPGDVPNVHMAFNDKSQECSAKSLQPSHTCLTLIYSRYFYWSDEHCDSWRVF